VTITAYGVLHAAGAGLAPAIAFHVADRAGLPRARSTAFLVSGFVGAFVAAKLGAFAVSGAAATSLDLLRTGGTSSLTIPVALLVGAFAARAFRLPPARALDVACAGAAPGIAVARIGCVFAGCCRGVDVDAPWLRSLFEKLGMPPVHPLPLYEVIVLAALTPFVLRRAVSGTPGTAAALFAATWGALHLAMAPLTPESSPTWLAAVQVTAASACLLIGAAVLARARAAKP